MTITRRKSEDEADKIDLDLDRIERRLIHLRDVEAERDRRQRWENARHRVFSARLDIRANMAEARRRKTAG